MVHRREIEGEEVVFGNQGALWSNAMTWWDHDTGSVWSQPLGEAIAGPRKGTRLELLPSTLTSWASWQASHPDTLALDSPAGRSGFDLARMVIVVELADEAVAYPVPELRRVGVANDIVAGLEIAVVIDPDGEDRWAVFSRRLDDRVVDLRTEGGRLVDLGTGTAWDPVLGWALDGPLEGKALDLLPGFTAFPEDFPIFWPEGRVWQGA